MEKVNYGWTVVIQLIIRSGAAHRVKGLGRTVITERALRINYKNYTVIACNVTDQLYDTVHYPPDVQCPQL